MDSEEEIMEVDKELEELKEEESIAEALKEKEDSVEALRKDDDNVDVLKEQDEPMSDLSQKESDSDSIIDASEETAVEEPSNNDDDQHKETDNVNKNEELQVKDISSDKKMFIKKSVEQSDSKPKPKSLPPLVPKDSATFRMQLGKDDIERMISEGTLEKMSETYYKVKSGSLKDIKTPSTFLAKNTISKPVLGQEKTDIQHPSVSSAITVQNLPSQLSVPGVVPKGSFVTLMQVNQVAGTGGTAFVALPIHQNTYNAAIPTYVTLPQAGASTMISNVSQVGAPIIPNVSQAATPIVPSVSQSQSAIPIVPNVSKAATPIVNTRAAKSKVREEPVINLREQTPAAEITLSPESTKPQSKVVSRETATAVPSPTLMSSVGTSAATRMKRKPQIESTRVRKPYRFAKPLRKRRKTTKLKDFVSDLNSSDEEEEIGLGKSKSSSTELASMFFKKIGEPNTTNKSLMDKLHKAIFNDTNMESDEEESEESDIEEVISDIKSGKAKYQTINCPGPSQYEAIIGPANNSKLSIIRCQETKQVKNFLYEIYKVRVTSAGREANTNILIPIPDGYKFEIPAKAKEEEVEFSHIPHEDPGSSNHVNPLFLEKLAETELKLRKCKDEIKVLRGRYLELLQEYTNRPQFSTLSDLVGAAAKFLTEDQLVFFLMQLKAGAHNMQGIRYSVREKILALSIYQKSPEVYKWLRKLFNMPSKRTLDQWLEEIGSQDPQLLKKLMYHIYTTYNFKADI